MDAVFLAPLPFPDSDRLVRVFSLKDGREVGPSAPDAADFAAQNRTLEGLVTFDAWRKNVSGIHGASEPEEMAVGLASPEYFQLLGLRPIMGRMFTDEENHYGRHYVALVTESLWRTRLAGDTAALGQKLLINDEPYAIVGIMPDMIPAWMHGRSILLWTPAEHTPPAPATESARQARGWDAIARLRNGTSLKQAQADLARIADSLAQQHPVDKGIGVRVVPLKDTRAGSLRSSIWLLVATVSVILLIACSNLANLLMARNAARTREFAVRSTLGALRPVLVRQLLVEAIVVSLVGSLFGLVLARIAVTGFVFLRPARLPQLAASGIDLRVLAFTLVVTVITGLLFGLMPALTGTRISLIEVMKEGGRTGAAGPRRDLLRRLLIVTEVAFSLTLVICASLLVKSIIRLQTQQTGFREDHLLKAHLFLPQVRYPSPAHITEFCDHLGEQLRGLPGIRAAIVTMLYPPANRWTQNFTIESAPASLQEDNPIARFGVTDGHYLQTLSIPLLRGRNFDDHDSGAASPVVLVNAEFVHRYFAGDDPIGRRIRLTGSEVTGAPAIRDPLTIIGVIGNTKNQGWALPVFPEIVALYRQIPEANFGFKDLVVRTVADPYAVAETIRQQLHRADPDVPFAEVATMDEVIAAQTSDVRFTTALFVLFALLGFVLAMIGVYGVVSYVAAQSTHEIGIRMALGAKRSDIAWLVAQKGLAMVGTGTAFGLCAAWAMQALVGHLLWGVSPRDPLVFAGATGLLLLVALLASAIPAFRAMRIHPIVALHYE